MNWNTVALNCLLEDPKIKEYLVKELIKRKLSSIGLKVKDIKTNTIWILATYDACCKLSWVNTETGYTWGGPFSNEINPLDILEGMEYELLLPEFK